MVASSSKQQIFRIRKIQIEMLGTITLNTEFKPSLRPWLLFAMWIALSLTVFWQPFTALLHYSLKNDNASHVLLIPFISAWLFFLDRKQIFNRISSDLPLAAAVLLIPAVVSGWAYLLSADWTPSEQITTYTLALVLVWIAGFMLFFGRAAAKLGWFPLLFLFLTVPLPDFVLNRVIYLLQKGSADIASTFFDWTGVPVLREGFVFHLPRVSIEVASECSGIRSSMALLILALLVGHFFLRSLWKQVAFVLCGLFVMIVKNGIRIVTLTLLANYVDPGFLFGNLHREGGVVFFLLGLLLLVPVLWLLQRGKPPLREDTEPNSRNFEKSSKS
jgi:exosortase